MAIIQKLFCPSITATKIWFFEKPKTKSVLVYIQLTQEERYHISVLCKEGFSSAEIARRLKRDPSTITRELKRNTSKRGYRAKQARERTLKRRHTSKKAIKFTTACAGISRLVSPSSLDLGPLIAQDDNDRIDSSLRSE